MEEGERADDVLMLGAKPSEAGGGDIHNPELQSTEIEIGTLPRLFNWKVTRGEGCGKGSNILERLGRKGRNCPRGKL